MTQDPDQPLVFDDQAQPPNHLEQPHVVISPEEQQAFEDLLAFLNDSTDGDKGTVITVLTREEFAEATFRPTNAAAEENLHDL